MQFAWLTNFWFALYNFAFALQLPIFDGFESFKEVFGCIPGYCGVYAHKVIQSHIEITPIRIKISMKR
jgi:hypothetical protein